MFVTNHKVHVNQNGADFGAVRCHDRKFWIFVLRLIFILGVGLKFISIYSLKSEIILKIEKNRYVNIIMRLRVSGKRITAERVL